MTVLGLHCCTRAFSSCGVPASHCSGFSCFRAQARGMQASVAAAPRLWSTGSVVVAQGLIAWRHVGSSWIGNQTHVSCIGRWMVDSLPLDHQGKPYNSILIGRLKKRLRGGIGVGTNWKNLEWKVNKSERFTFQKGSLPLPSPPTNRRKGSLSLSRCFFQIFRAPHSASWKLLSLTVRDFFLQRAIPSACYWLMYFWPKKLSIEQDLSPPGSGQAIRGKKTGESALS